MRQKVLAGALVGLFSFSAVTCIAQLPSDTTTRIVAANQRIPKIRKGDVDLFVSTHDGEPVPYADIKVEQIESSFLFGCAALSVTKHKDVSAEKSYLDQFSKIFNFATVLTYWQDLSPTPDKDDLTLLTAQVRSLRERNITIKGHPLFLAGAAPSWAGQDPELARSRTEARINKLTKLFANQITVWDVVGDSTSAAGARTGLGAWAKKAGVEKLTSDCFKWAKTSTPNGTMLYNDYNLDDAFVNLIKGLQRSKTPPDVLGLEAHMVGSEWDWTKLQSTVDRFASLKIPLHFSEITVLSGSPKANADGKWPTTKEGEALQADYVEDMYTIMFSQPSVTGIAWWNFVDGDWDRIPNGLLRSDLSPKPAYDRLNRLINEKWKTNMELTGTSYGTAGFKGFGGKYRVTVNSPYGYKTEERILTAGKHNQWIISVP